MPADQIDITGLEEYGPAYAAYRAAKRAAQDAENPELAAAQADLAWERKVGELTNLAISRERSDTRRKEALAQAAKDFPDAPATAYQHLTDPDQILATAKQVHDGINEKLTAQQQSWGTPPQAGQPASPQQQTSDERLMALVPDVEKGRTDANEAYRREVFKERVGSRFDFTKPRR